MSEDIGLPAKYDPKLSESKWQQHWEDAEIFVQIPNAESFTIDTPPPTVSGKMHIGHAYSYAQQDFYARFWRMKTKNVFFPFGTDDNGLATIILVEKTKGVKGTRMDRKAFRDLCFQTVKELKPVFISDWKRIGMSCDFSTTYSTIDEHCQATSQRSFIELFKKGRIYRKETPAAWCVQCQTAIAQAEFESKDLSSTFNDLTFTIGHDHVTIATTRPELLAACVALAAHPQDNRYTKYKGMKAKVPLFDYEVPIIFDDSVDQEKGTGIMMVCTFGDKEDIQKWFIHNLPLRSILEKDGTLGPLAQRYAGMKIKDVKKQILDDLKEKGYLTAQRQFTHAVNVHERCGTEIEFLKTPQWYIKLLDIKDELVQSGKKVTWYPEHMFVRYQHWVENLNWDWCISRQRSYGIPVPVWHGSDGKMYLPDESQLPVDPFYDLPKNVPDGVTLTPESDTLDTWATSSVTPQIILKWNNDRKNAESLLPMSLRPQAQDIIRTWAFYTITMSYLHHNKTPWQNIAISGYVTDPHGQKMSKSKGNVVDPQTMVEKYCADAIRYWAAGCKLGDDVPFHEKELQSAQRTMTKLWNASKFVLQHLSSYNNEWTGRFDELELLDRWILTKCNLLVKECTEAFTNYEHYRAKMALEQFFWSDLCDQYLEIVKGRLYEPKDHLQRQSAQFTVSHVLRTVIGLFSPFMPFITEELYQLKYAKTEEKKSVHISDWPIFREDWVDHDAMMLGSEIVQVIAEVRKFKTENKLAMNAPIGTIVIRTKHDLTMAENDLLSVTKASSLQHEPSEEFSVLVNTAL